MEIVIFVLAIFLSIPSVTTAIDSHRNANWQKTQALVYLCSMDKIPPEYENMCTKLYSKEESQKSIDFMGKGE